MADPDFHTHDDTPVTEVAVVLHVQGHVNMYDLTIAAEKIRQLLRWDSVQREGRECSLTFATAVELERFDVSEVGALATRSTGTSRALPRESSPAPS